MRICLGTDIEIASQCICPQMIILRIVSGKAWRKDALERRPARPRDHGRSTGIPQLTSAVEMQYTNSAEYSPSDYNPTIASTLTVKEKQKYMDCVEDAGAAA